MAVSSRSRHRRKASIHKPNIQKRTVDKPDVPAAAQKPALEARALATLPEPSPQKPTLKERALHELRRFTVMSLYLWVLFALFSIHQSIVLAEHDIDYRAQGFAFINALMLAKVMLIGEDLHLGRRFKDRRLVYSILYQSLAFAILFICFHIVERLLIGIWDGKTIAESFPEIGGGSLKGILSAGTIISVSLIPFFAFKAIGEAMGERELWALFFGRGGRDSGINAKTAKTPG